MEISSWNHKSRSNLFSKPPLWCHSPALRPESPASQVHRTWQSTQRRKQIQKSSTKEEKQISKTDSFFFLSEGTTYGLIYPLTQPFVCCNRLWPICACVIYKKNTSRKVNKKHLSLFKQTSLWTHVIRTLQKNNKKLAKSAKWYKQNQYGKLRLLMLCGSRANIV